MGLSLNPLKKLWDQIDITDNGKTWKNQQGNGQNQSVLHQLTHNGATNVVGGIVKPVTNTVAVATVDPLRELVAQATNNTAAFNAQRARSAQDLQGSLPYQVGNTIVRAGQAGANLGFKAPILDIMGHSAEADKARVAGLQEFNQTPFGQLTRPIQYGIANTQHASNGKQEDVGLDPNATGAQKYFSDPVQGAVGSYGLLKGGEQVINKAADIKAGKPTPSVPVKVTVKDESTPGQPVDVRTPVRVTVKDKSTGETTVKVTNPVKRVDEIRQQLDAMPSPQDIEVAKFNQRSNLAKTVQSIRQSTYDAAKKRELVKKITERYKQNQAKLDETVKSRAALDEEASQLKMNPSYQAARPVGDVPVVANRAIDTEVIPQYRQMQRDVEGIKTAVGDDETGANSVKIKGPASREVKIKVRTPNKPGTDNLQKLNIKIKNVKDPVRKAELIAEREARFPNRAQVNVKPKQVVEAQSGPNAFNRAWQSARGVISQHGEGGKEIANRLQKQRDNSEIGQEAFVEKIPTVIKLKKKEFSKFADELEARSNGKTTGKLSPKIEKAVAEWNEAIPSIRERAVQAGLDVGDLGENYFPRFYKDLNSVRGTKQLAARMVKAGEAKDIGEAMGKLRLMQRDYTRTFGNLERNRTANIGGYEKTHESLLNYISRSYDRITKAEQFGGKNEALNELMGAIEQEGYNVAKGSPFDRTLRTALGDTDYSTAAHKASRAIRQVNAARSLSTSSITNLGQGVNTATVGGVFRTIKAVGKALTSKNERAGARQAGVLLDHTINDLAKQGLGVNGKIFSNIASPLFRSVEKFNRTTAAIVGKDWGNTLAKRASNGSKYAENILREKLGVTGEIGSKLTREQEIQASRRLVEDTQFKVDPQDLPAWVDTPTGKVVAQFRTFGYKQTGFVYNQVLREAAKGNFLPLTRFVLTGAPAGVASAAAKGALRGNIGYNGDDFKKDKILATVGNGLKNVGAGGLPLSETTNLATSSNYGNTLQGVAGLVGGPTGSIIGETAANVDKARNDNTQPLKKEAIRNIPGVGSVLASRIYPSKVTDATTKYFAALNSAEKTFRGDKKGAAEFSDYIARSKDSESGKSIQQSPAESLNSSRTLFANDKVRKAIVQFEKASGKHAPSWNLPDGMLKDYMQYKSQYTGDAAKNALRDSFEKKYGDGSIQKIQDADSKFFDNLPKGKGSIANPQTPKYPTFDDSTKTLMATYNAADTTTKSQIMSQYGDKITDYFDKTAQYTNAMRRAEGAPEKSDYPQQPPEVKEIMAKYYALPTGDGANGRNVSRSAWIKSNPDAYAKMQNYLSQSSLYSLINEASKAQFKGTSPSQKLLKEVKNLGQYDIATYKDADGNTVYALNPADAYSQSKGGSGSGYALNTEGFRVSAPKKIGVRTKFAAKSKASSAKAKSASGKPVVNKKVALVKSKV